MKFAPGATFSVSLVPPQTIRGAVDPLLVRERERDTHTPSLSSAAAVSVHHHASGASGALVLVVVGAGIRRCDLWRCAGVSAGRGG